MLWVISTYLDIVIMVQIGCTFDMTYATLLWVFYIITEKSIYFWKKFRFYIHSVRVSLHKEDANIRCKSDFYPTKTCVKIFSNQNQNEILALFLPTRATTMTPRNTLSALHTRCIRTIDTSVRPETKAE